MRGTTRVHRDVTEVEEVSADQAGFALKSLTENRISRHAILSLARSHVRKVHWWRKPYTFLSFSRTVTRWSITVQASIDTCISNLENLLSSFLFFESGDWMNGERIQVGVYCDVLRTCAIKEWVLIGQCRVFERSSIFDTSVWRIWWKDTYAVNWGLVTVVRFGTCHLYLIANSRCTVYPFEKASELMRSQPASRKCFSFMLLSGVWLWWYLLSCCSHATSTDAKLHCNRFRCLKQLALMSHLLVVERGSLFLITLVSIIPLAESTNPLPIMWNIEVD